MDNQLEIVPEVTLRSQASEHEVLAYRSLAAKLAECPIPASEVLSNLPLFLDRATMAHLMFMQGLYRRILPVPGIILEFGVRWGRNLAILTSCRTLFETHNTTRRIVGFDTFEGFPSVAPEDGVSEATGKGGYGVHCGHEEWLAGVLADQEMLGFRGERRRFELVKGDVMETLPRYLEKHPETIVAMAYFDMDLYEPTKKALQLIEPHLTKGSVIGFDELHLPEFPGETLALKHAWGLSRYRIQRDPNVPYPSKSFLVVE